MNNYPSIGDIFSWPSREEKKLLIVAYSDNPEYLEVVCDCLLLGTSNLLKVRRDDLMRIAKKIG